MKVLVAIAPNPAGEGDFCFARPGELVTLPFECDRPGCGCDRSFSGLDSRKGTTTVQVVEREDLTPDEFRRSLVASHIRAGFADAPLLLERRARDLLKLAENSFEGDIWRRFGDQFIKRFNE